MVKTFGIRREDKNEWEKRVPLIPEDIQELLKSNDLKAIVQPSQIRIFSDEDFVKAGAIVSENLSDSDVVFAVKEIPVNLLEEHKTYVFFSHTIKGQPYNMKMLKRLMALKCNLIDYEKMTNDQNARIITFSVFAGIAGMIETLYAFAQKLRLQGIATPFDSLKQAYQYDSIDAAKKEIKQIGKLISENGLPKELHPLTIGILGYGNVSKGAQEILDLLPIKTLEPSELKAGLKADLLDNKTIYKTVFAEKDMVEAREGTFQLQDYYQHPEKYKSIFHQYLPFLKILVNSVYWTESYPRTVTRSDLKNHLADMNSSGVSVIGDISCDINGSIEITRDSTKPDNACFTYHAETDSFEDGISATGVTVMAIDNLPCEFSKEASTSFSRELKRFVNDIATADYSCDFENLKLPPAIKKATILLKGELTPQYRYIEEYL